MKTNPPRPIVVLAIFAASQLLSGCGEQTVSGDVKNEVNPNFSPAHKAMIEKRKAEEDRK